MFSLNYSRDLGNGTEESVGSPAAKKKKVSAIEVQVQIAKLLKVAL